MSLLHPASFHCAEVLIVTVKGSYPFQKHLFTTMCPEIFVKLDFIGFIKRLLVTNLW